MTNNFIELAKIVSNGYGLSSDGQSFLQEIHDRECSFLKEIVPILTSVLCSPYAGELEKGWAQDKLDNILGENHAL